MAKQSTEIEQYKLSSSDLQEMQSFEDALRVLQERGIEVHSSTEFGDGFVKPDADNKSIKAKLVGVKMIIVSAQETEDDNGREFTVFRAITENGSRIVFSDGSTGLAAEAHDWLTKHGGQWVPIIANHGLRRSDYDFENDKGEIQSATTFYLDTTP